MVNLPTLKIQTSASPITFILWEQRGGPKLLKCVKLGVHHRTGIKGKSAVVDTTWQPFCILLYFSEHTTLESDKQHIKQQALMPALPTTVRHEKLTCLKPQPALPAYNAYL